MQGLARYVVIMAVLLLLLQCCVGLLQQPVNKVTRKHASLKQISHPHMKVHFSGTAIYAKKDRDATRSSGGKGFGSVVEATKPPTPTTAVNTDSSAAEATKEELESAEMLSDSDKIRSTKLFRKMKLQKIESLQEKLKYLQEEERLLASDPSVGAVPELVAERMIKRIALFFGIPVFGGLMVFVAAYFYSKKYDVVVPPTIIAYATQFPFVIGLLGITYAIISSSWDEEDGSALGIQEFKTNLQRIRDGFSRSRETAKLQNDIEKELDELRGMDK